jgi:ATP adenylyltransferase
MNLYPYNNGHLLLVPYRPVPDYTELTDGERAELAALIGRAIGWLRAALRPDGFNVGMNQGEAGGAGIPDHLHVHVVPRWRADTNFMPVTAEAKVIPEALRATYEKLLDAVRREEPAGR